jgi:hypothetical protein
MPWLVALPLLGLLLLVGWWLMQPDDGLSVVAAATTPAPASGEPATPTSPAATTESATSITESATSTTETTTPTSESATSTSNTATSESTSTTPTPAPPTSAEVEQAALDYYRTAPRDPEGAWELLLPEAQGDRDAFDDRWRDVSRADLQDLSIDGDRATAEVHYRGKGGEQVTRTESLTFARGDDGTVRISSLEVTAEEETDPGNDDDDDDDKGRDDDKDNDDR